MGLSLTCAMVVEAKACIKRLNQRECRGNANNPLDGGVRKVT